jgi:hypothetical protein
VSISSGGLDFCNKLLHNLTHQDNAMVKSIHLKCQHKLVAALHNERHVKHDLVEGDAFVDDDSFNLRLIKELRSQEILFMNGA